MLELEVSHQFISSLRLLYLENVKWFAPLKPKQTK